MFIIYGLNFSLIYGAKVFIKMNNKRRRRITNDIKIKVIHKTIGRKLNKIQTVKVVDIKQTMTDDCSCHGVVFHGFLRYIFT